MAKTIAKLSISIVYNFNGFFVFFCISRIMFKKSNSTREMTKNKQKENTKRQINQKAKGNKQKLRHDKKKDKKG